MNLKKKVCAIALAGAVAVSALSLGFAAWHTDITAAGSVSAQGSWAVSLTDASLTTSETGAQIAQDYSNYHLQANELTATQVGNLCIGAAAPKGTSGTLGTQSSTVGLNPEQQLPPLPGGHHPDRHHPVWPYSHQRR